MAEDLRTLLEFREELARTLTRLDERISEAQKAQQLTPEEVRMRHLDNAVTDGSLYARIEGYHTPDAEPELRRVFEDMYRRPGPDGTVDPQLVDQAMSGARRTWREHSSV